MRRSYRYTTALVISVKKRSINFQEELLLDPMYDVPGSDIIGVCIDEEVVRSNKKPDYVRSPQDSHEYESENEEKKEPESARLAAYND